MARVYLSIGSNVDREKHISASLNTLAEQFGELLLSSIYESEAVGFDGENFFNLVVGINTNMAVGSLSHCLRQIEHINGRSREGPKFSSRTLDIDILTYANIVGAIDGVDLPREEIVHNAFVLKPMAEIVPGAIHPVLKVSYAELWASYDKSRQKLWPVDFSWRGKRISSAGEVTGYGSAQ